MSGNNARSFPWVDMPFFLALARAGNPTKAAKVAKIDRTTMVRRLDHLEAQLGRQLFDRVPGAYQLTVYGRKVFAAAERAEQELSPVAAGGTARFALGRVRLSMSEQIMAGFAPVFAAMTRAVPDILLEFATSDQFVDLSRFEADIALRLSRKPPQGLHNVDLGEVGFALYRPVAATDADTRFVTRPGENEAPGYIRDFLPEAQQVASVDGMVSVQAMVRAGVGTGILPLFLGRADPALVEVGQITVGQPFRLYAACLSEQRNLERIRQVLSFLRKNLPQHAAPPLP